MKRIIPLLLLAAAAAAAVRYYPRWFGKPPASNVLKLSGNIEAHESLVSFKVTGRIVALPVDEGMTIKAGRHCSRGSTTTTTGSKWSGRGHHERARPPACPGTRGQPPPRGRGGASGRP